MACDAVQSLDVQTLGGCDVGVSLDKGVVNYAGEVFGYKDLYVADRPIVPRALGVNPSRTIAALAARISVGMNRGGS